MSTSITLPGAITENNMENAISVGLSAASALLLRGMITQFDITKIGGIEFVREIIGGANEPAAIVLTDGHLYLCNKAMEEFLGRKESELRRLHFKDFTVDEYIDIDIFNFTELLDGRIDHYEVTKAWKKPDKSRAVGDMKVRPIAPGGEIMATYVTVRPQRQSITSQSPSPKAAPVPSGKSSVIIHLVREIGMIQYKGKFAFAFFVVIACMWLFAGGGLEYLLDKFFP